MAIRICVLLWRTDAPIERLRAYEDAVLALLPEYEGRVLQRLAIDAAGDEPCEVQVIEFASAQHLDDFMHDDRRLALADEREATVLRTQVLHVEDVQRAGY
ncbi:MAG: hypothetical protein PHU75_09590 [Candidatus Nanopelagicales bacterium]|nr:hypothetical protein [Candidatus Nanopelagicales bacterium]